MAASIQCMVLMSHPVDSWRCYRLTGSHCC